MPLLNKKGATFLSVAPFLFIQFYIELSSILISKALLLQIIRIANKQSA
jgi:hypothetical protein